MITTEPVHLSDYGRIFIDGNEVRWSYSHKVKLRCKVTTDEWSTVDKSLGLSGFNLRTILKRLRYKFTAVAKAAARLKYTAELDAEEKRKKLIDAKPINVLSEDLVR